MEIQAGDVTHPAPAEHRGLAWDAKRSACVVGCTLAKISVNRPIRDSVTELDARVQGLLNHHRAKWTSLQRVQNRPGHPNHSGF